MPLVPSASSPARSPHRVPTPKSAPAPEPAANHAQQAPRRLPRFLHFSLHFKKLRSASQTAPMPPAPSATTLAIAPHGTGLSSAPNGLAAPPFPAGTGEGRITQRVGAMDRDARMAAAQMHAAHYSFVDAQPSPPFGVQLTFERNAHTFQILAGPDAAEWAVITEEKVKDGWTYFGRRSQGSFNQVLIYIR